MADAHVPPTALQPYKDQVGGHTDADGKPSSLTDSSGRFYKPIQSEQRFLREKAFYEQISALATSKTDPDQNGLSQHAPGIQSLQRFVPKYHGSVLVEGKHHLVLQDLCWGYKQPCIMDVKMGYKTWYPWAEQKYIDKCIEKDEGTTQSTLGFRVCGAQVHDPATGELFRADRHWGKDLTADTMLPALLRYVPEGGPLTRQGIFTAILDRLEQLQISFQQQRQFVFFASSVLFMYEGAAASDQEADVKVYLVDFAHVYDAQGGRDDNFIAGLESLMAHLRQCAGVEAAAVGAS